MTNRTLGDIGADMLTGPSVDSIFGPVIEAGVPHYTREHLYKRLNVALFQEELADFSVTGCELIVAKLEKACASQRALGMRANWSYSTNLHIGLLIALKAEKQNLARARTSEGVPQITWGDCSMILRAPAAPGVSWQGEVRPGSPERSQAGPRKANQTKGT